MTKRTPLGSERSTRTPSMLRTVALLLVVAVFVPSGAEAQEREAVPQVVPDEQPITYGAMLRTYRRLQPKSDSLSAGLIGAFQTGLVVDETLTRFGRDFYELFYRQWQAPDGVVAYTILVQEQPLPGQSTLITIRLDSEIVYQARLQPGEEYREQVAQAALQTTYQRLRATE